MADTLPAEGWSQKWETVDRAMPPMAHQIVGMCFGFIFCLWLVGAPSEQVWFLRLPAAIVLLVYVSAVLIGFVRALMKS